MSTCMIYKKWSTISDIVFSKVYLCCHLTSTGYRTIEIHDMRKLVDIVSISPTPFDIPMGLPALPTHLSTWKY